MKKHNFFTIENKILIPFVCITLISVAFLCVVFYRMESSIKLEAESVNAQAMVDYINADIDAGHYWTNPDALLKKYESTYRGEDLFLYDEQERPLFARRERSEDEIVLQDSRENRLGWRIVYSLDRQTLRNTFIDEQRYVILGAVAMLLIIVQASMLIAYHISNPIWELSQLCTRISQNPEQAQDLELEYIHRRDEVGQLAAAFQSMMDSMRLYTDELSWVKALNESIVANLPLGVVVCDEYQTIIFRNTRAETMLARWEETDAQNRNLNTIVSEMVLRDEILPAPAKLRGPDGKWRNYELGAWKLHHPDGGNWGTLYTIDDVTYQRHMEEKLSRDEKLAYTGQLAADIAHEARNPLAGIRAGLQVVGRKLSDQRDEMLCREMIKEVDRVNLLVENLLNVSRKRESEKTTVALNGLSEELVLLYSKVAENKGVQLSVQMEENLWVLADEQELRQILINLINNSIKAMVNGGRINLYGRRAVEGVSIVVEDNGPGMQQDKLEEVLQGETGGLGLPIVQRLAAQNGGALQFETLPGQGTRVTLTFHGTGGTNHEI